MIDFFSRLACKLRFGGTTMYIIENMDGYRAPGSVDLFDPWGGKTGLNFCWYLGIDSREQVWMFRQDTYSFRDGRIEVEHSEFMKLGPASEYPWKQKNSEGAD